MHRCWRNLLRLKCDAKHRFATENTGISSFSDSLRKPRFPQRHHAEVRHLGSRRLPKRCENHGFPSHLTRSAASDGRPVASETAILKPVFCSIEPETPDRSTAPQCSTAP